MNSRLDETCSILRTGTSVTSLLGEIFLRPLADLSFFKTKYTGKAKDRSLILLEPDDYSSMLCELNAHCKPDIQLAYTCHSNDSTKLSQSRHFSFWFTSNISGQECINFRQLQHQIEMAMREANSDASFLRQLMKLSLEYHKQNGYCLTKIFVHFFDPNGYEEQTVLVDSVSSSKGVSSSCSRSSLKQQCLNLLESAYPNYVHIDNICSILKVEKYEIEKILTELQFENFISEVDSGFFLRQLAGEEILDVSEKHGSSAMHQKCKLSMPSDPEIGIIVNRYIDKIAVDAFLHNKTTFRHRCESARVSSHGANINNVYTAGVWQHKGKNTTVVTLKIPGCPGNKEKSSIASGSVTTRLFGRFPSLKKIVVIYNGIGVVSKDECENEIQPGNIFYSDNIIDFVDKFGELKSNTKSSRAKLLSENAKDLSKDIQTSPESLDNLTSKGYKFLSNQNSLSFDQVNNKPGRGPVSISQRPIASISGNMSSNSLCEIIHNHKNSALCRNLGPIIDSTNGNGINHFIVFCPITRCISSLDEWNKCEQSSDMPRKQQNNSEKMETAMKCAAGVFELINKTV